MFNQEQYKAKLTELSALKEKVKLASDPVAAGLNSFNTVIAEIQGCRERIASLSLEALWNKNEAQEKMKTAEFLYENKAALLMSSDQEVRGEKSKELREAKSRVIMAPELQSLHEAEQLFSYADSFHRSVTIVEKLYDVKNDNLLQQIMVVRMMTNIDPALRDELKIQMKGKS